MSYDHHTIEKKWLDKWEETKLFQQTEKQGDGVWGVGDSEKEYLLFAFAYPSGSGLHVGHVESSTALDIMARYYRMKGKKVFFPVGWDAFGLPAENYAVKTGVHPAETTKKAIKKFGEQVRRIGISYDWANEIATNHPGYYKWTQWLFLQLYNKGLAYKNMGMVNWCPSCQTVLANEQVIVGNCERCGTAVIQKALEQWYFKITQYKDELIEGLAKVDWPEATKAQQLHWIGKKDGVEVGFRVQGMGINEDTINCFTTRIDTIFGVTFMVIAPELAKQWMEAGWDASAEVRAYVETSFSKTEEERKVGEKEKTGVDSGLLAINPVNNAEVPVYVADYVLMDVGTGCVMGVPAHDERDKAFASKFGLPTIDVIKDQITDYGELINSGEFNGMTSQVAMEAIPERYPDLMKKTTTYKLRDWLISRQRYWGVPIPVVYDPEGKAHLVKEEHLPWLLPTDVDFKPTGESPLKSSKEFIERTERLYGKDWRPEFDTMDTFVDSSWYYLRYTDARNEQAFAAKEQLAKWLPVDFYMIGPEHIVLHLLYSRFLTKFLRDEGHLSVDEPFMKMRHQGMILGPDHRKMSKSKGNVIDPDEVISQYGADTLRMYEMFMGPIGDDKPWSTTSVVGTYRFLERVWRLFETTIECKTENQSSTLQSALAKLVGKVNEDIPNLKFNTAISAMMIFVNEWENQQTDEVVRVMSMDDLGRLVALLAPYAPFMAEEMWSRLGNTESVHLARFPEVTDFPVVAEDYKVMVSVNGKVRQSITVTQEEYRAMSNPEAVIMQRSQTDERVSKWLIDKTVERVIFVPPTVKRQGMLNIVLR